MRRTLFIAWVLCLATVLHAYDKTYAVIVAVADYKYFSAYDGDLNYTLNDARLFYEFLKSRKGGSVPSANIVYLTESNASKANIIAQAKSLFSRAKKNDRVIFYYSGHGGSGCFVPYDADSYGNNLLYFSEVKSIFKCTESSTKLLFADACFSGSMKGFKSKSVQKRLRQEKSSTSHANIAVMMSCQNNETSVEMSSLGQGVFTYYLMKGLGGAANKDNSQYVTITELFSYVYRKTRSKASEIGHKQTPMLFGDFDTRLIVAKP